MRNSKTLSTRGERKTAKRLRDLDEPEIRAYISSLKESYSKYRQPVVAGRRIVDGAMKNASLTALLYESREQ
jgi:hypothetical protein